MIHVSHLTFLPATHDAVPPTTHGVDGRTRPSLALVLLAFSLTAGGCGTTKWTDTSRSGTEQMLLSNAMDHAVSNVDLDILSGKTVYLNSKPVSGAIDSAYLVSTLRQHILASGCLLREKEEDAEYVIEVRAGAMGTDRDDVLYGIPAVSIPAAFPVEGAMIGAGQQIPEIPFVKKTRQRAVAKIALFAYNRETGRPVWQSGISPVESEAKAWWVFGAGPIQRGQIYRGTRFAGEKVNLPTIRLGASADELGGHKLSVFDQAIFPEWDQGHDARVASRPKDAAPAENTASPSPAETTAPAGSSTPQAALESPRVSNAGAPAGSTDSSLAMPPISAERWVRTPVTASPAPNDGLSPRPDPTRQYFPAAPYNPGRAPASSPPPAPPYDPWPPAPPVWMRQ